MDMDVALLKPFGYINKLNVYLFAGVEFNNGLMSGPPKAEILKKIMDLYLATYNIKIRA